MSAEAQYAVLCRGDGKVRDISTADPQQAARWAADRDKECGCCYQEHNPHVVVARLVTPWEPVDRRAASRVWDGDWSDD